MILRVSVLNLIFEMIFLFFRRLGFGGVGYIGISFYCNLVIV